MGDKVLAKELVNGLVRAEDEEEADDIDIARRQVFSGRLSSSHSLINPRRRNLHMHPKNALIRRTSVLARMLSIASTYLAHSGDENGSKAIE